MKKLFLMLLCMTAWNSNIHAEKQLVELEINIIDDHPVCPGKGKAPLRVPAIYQEGYTLYLPSFHPEYLINIVQGEEIVFTSIIPEDVAEYEMPAYLEGECHILFIYGSFCFTGYISL